MLVKIFSGAVNGIEATTITLEVNILNGAKFIIVGLPDNAVKRKSATDRFGPAGDLPFPVSVIILDVQGSAEFYDVGRIITRRKFGGGKRGTFLSLSMPGARGFKSIIVPLENANEAAVVEGIHVYGFSHIREVTDFLNGKQQAEPFTFDPTLSEVTNDLLYDFKDVKGQETIKRALELQPPVLTTF